MIRALDTIVARVILVSLLGITLVHVLSLWTYQRALDQELSRAHEASLAERLISIQRSVALAPRDQREALAHDLSGGPIEAHWNSSRGAVAGGPGVEAWTGLGEQIRRFAENMTSGDVVIGTSTDPHVALLSIRLPDDSWLNVSLFAASPARGTGHGTLLSTSLMALGVVLMSLLMARWLTRPIREIADAVTLLSPDDAASSVPEAGPREVRHLARSFNDMRRRIAELVTRRTQALAAVSHDLRTPLTRLRLRLDDLADPALQRAMATDIDEMEEMVEATLSYLKGDQPDEPRRAVDLVALLETIVNDARDMGRDAELTAPAHLVVNTGMLGMKRALSNLVSNALRYGTRARVEVRHVGDDVVVTIDDDGPGIPPEKLDAVLEPFVRLEESRNLTTGGVGLGLTIAKNNIEANGGKLRLANRDEGGLSVTVVLPAAM
ncbi:MAG: HAMP domain-containing protein [Hyphomicrobiaceae bacterium]|nr:HAMP domain-containing protein [Hyphomicrobiaceae bacterium]